MGSTVWSPMTRMEPKSWLLGNGEIVKEPALEMSGSGRKVRVAGSTNSVFETGLDSLISEAAEVIAEKKGTHVWLDVSTPVETQIADQAGFVPAATKASLHLVNDPTNTSAQTICWWRFKDPSTPFEVLLTATLKPSSVSGAPGRQYLSSWAYVPTRTYHTPSTPQVAQIGDTQFDSLLNHLYYRNDQLKYKWLEFLNAEPVEWPMGDLGEGHQPHPRAAVTALLNLVRSYEDLETIQVPDFSDPDNPSLRELELYATNVNAEFLNDLTEYLDGAPTIEQAAQLYDQMLQTLRSVGILVQDKSSNDFMAALLAGEKATLHMEVYALAEQGNNTDTDHKLSVHLPTGTFIVECTHQDVDQTEVAEKWEEALTMASLTGQEDTLLAYARGYAKEAVQNRTNAILKERKAK
jgi:hypothetical protein